MKTLVVANQKGGVGKTTLLVHFAHYAAETGNRVLVIDLDPQGNTSSSLEAFTSAISSSALFDSSWAADSPVAANAPITLIAADAGLINLDRAKLDVAGVFVEHVRKLSASTRFDLCLVDTAPALGLRMIAAVTAANYVISPIELQTYSIDGIAAMLKTIYAIRRQFNPDLKVLGMLPSRVNSHSPAQKASLVALLNSYPDLVMRRAIRLRTSVAEAAGARKPVWALQKTSARKAGHEMKAVLAHIIERMGGLSHVA